MADDSGDQSTDTAGVETAFQILSHELRLDILHALWEAEGFTLSFADLRKAVGERDSGSFTYHLSKLEDQFVVKTGNGYELQYPGHRVLDAIQSGVFHGEATVGPVALEERCHDCGGSISFTYDTDCIGRVHCMTCENRILEWPFDPGGVAARGEESIVDAFDRRTRLIWTCALETVCPFCSGQVRRRMTSHVADDGVCIGVIENLDRYDEFFASDHPVIVALECDRCSFYSFLPVGVILLTRPAVLGRLHASGIVVRQRPLWDLPFVVDPSAVTRRDTDPISADVAVRASDQSMTFTISSAFEVKKPEATEQ